MVQDLNIKKAYFHPAKDATIWNIGIYLFPSKPHLNLSEVNF